MHVFKTFIVYLYDMFNLISALNERYIFSIHDLCVFWVCPTEQLNSNHLNFPAIVHGGER